MALVTVHTLNRGIVVDTCNPGLGNRLAQDDLKLEANLQQYDTVAKYKKVHV